MKGKGTAALVLALMGGKKPKGEEDEMDMEDSPESSSGEAKSAAAEEVMAAVKANDAKALADALESFIECCGD